jgi:hypothetical protein
MAAIPPVDLKPGSGVIILSLLSPPPTVCVGESVPIQVFVQDAVYGLPPGLTDVTMTSRLGANASVYTVGGPTTLTYKPETEGTDTIQINAFNVYSSPGILSLPARVEHCGWTWKLSYSGTYPNPQGYWTYYEAATVGNGTLQVQNNGQDLELSGTGTIDFSVDADGSDANGSCSLDQTPAGSASVHVEGKLDQPSPGSMMLKFSFEPVRLPGGSKFLCQVQGQEVTIPFPLPNTTVELNTLPLSAVVLPTGSSSYSQSVSTALVWLLPGNGSVELSLSRLSP